MTLNICNATAGYGSTLILNGVSCVFGPGINVIIGKNGAGKSTLAKVIAGLIPLRGGSIHDESGKNLPRKAVERARVTAYLAQKNTSSWPLSVRDIVAQGRYPYTGTARAADNAAVIERSLANCGIGHFAARNINGLSGGEQQLVFLARALCQETPVLILDEPFSAMDPARVCFTVQLLRKTAADGTAVIVILHDIVTAQTAADHVVIIGNGQTAAEGSPHDVLTEERLRSVYGTPFAPFKNAGRTLLIPGANT